MAKQLFDEAYGSKPPENYERFFVPTIGEPVARDLIRRADLRPGERVLDVACATGIIARLALKEVGNTGNVTGLDINPGMLAVARSITQDSKIEWFEASAEDMPFSDESFDVVFCQMGLQFMEDKTAALKEMHRMLAPGGRLILNVPGPAGTVFEIMSKAMGRNISPEAKGFVNNVFCLNDINEIRQLISTAGFRDVEVEAINKIFSLPAPKDFLWQYVHSTLLAGEVGKKDKEAHNNLEREVVEKWQQFTEDGIMMYKQRIVAVSALK